MNLPVTEGDPPIGWWNEDADKSLVIGVYKHGMLIFLTSPRIWTSSKNTEVMQFVMFAGYERYNAIRADPCLIFLKTCGPPTSSDDAATGDAIDGEGLR